MIQRPTVFILGAGASAPYGFPTGGALRDILIKGANCVSNGHDVGEQVRNFKIALKGSRLESIDEFLEKRQDMLGIGKLCLSAALMKYEQPEHSHCSYEKDWLQSLWGVLHRNSGGHISKNRVTIINYNYDRLIEHALTEAMAHTFRVNREQAWEEIQKLNIIHPHGMLGAYEPLPPLWDKYTPAERTRVDFHQSDVSRGFYTLRRTELNNRIAANGLRLFWEDGEHARSARERMQDSLTKAECVIFLGFGFLDANMKHLVPMLSMCRAGDWAATTLGLGDRKVNVVQKQIPALAWNTRLFRSECRYLLDNIESLD